MIDNKEYDQLAVRVERILRGTVVVSDRVSDRIEELFGTMEAMPFRPSTNPEDWGDFASRQPQVARMYADSLYELEYLLGAIDDRRGGSDEITETGQPTNIEVS